VNVPSMYSISAAPQAAWEGTGGGGSLDFGLVYRVITRVAVALGAGLSLASPRRSADT
jgi:hypothetical protein